MMTAVTPSRHTRIGGMSRLGESFGRPKIAHRAGVIGTAFA
jgi:hypothetical protein